jgi:hypothetical protein
MDTLTALSGGSGADTVALQDVLEQLRPLQQVLVPIGRLSGSQPCCSFCLARQLVLNGHGPAMSASSLLYSRRQGAGTALLNAQCCGRQPPSAECCRATCILVQTGCTAASSCASLPPRCRSPVDPRCMVRSSVPTSRFSCCPQAAGELQQAQERQARTAAAVEALERRLEAAVSLLPAADAAIAGAQGAQTNHARM